MSTSDQFDANWNYPTQIKFGPGRISELAEACSSLNISKPLLVTDPGLAGLAMVEEILNTCQLAGLKVELFKDVKPNPTGENVIAGLEAYDKGNHDGVIALGGGSPLDAGKAIALMVGQKHELWDFEDVGDNWLRVNSETIAPIIAIPTTAGTGSEVGRASVIHDVKAQKKKIIFHPKMLPQIVIADPELTIGLNVKLTAATGMDALSHKLEAYCAPGYHPMADGIAMEGIRLIKNNLVDAVQDGTNIAARSNMLAASMMGATAFQKGLGGMHALAHPLGAIYDVHHGLLNAILMPYVLKYNQKAIDSRVERLARYISLDDASFDGFLDWVIDLRKKVGIPNRLSEIGIGRENLHTIAQMAVEDPSSGGNPKVMTKDDYVAILEEAIVVDD